MTGWLGCRQIVECRQSLKTTEHVNILRDKMDVMGVMPILAGATETTVRQYLE